MASRCGTGLPGASRRENRACRRKSKTLLEIMIVPSIRDLGFFKFLARVTHIFRKFSLDSCRFMLRIQFIAYTHVTHLS